MIRSVCDHVKPFPLVESHYIRKNSKKLYLEGIKSASRMFTLHCEWIDGEKYRAKALTKRQYREMLNANCNIGFHKPKKDLCDICHVYLNKKIPTEEEKSTFLKHQAARKAARHLKQQDKDAAKSNNSIVAATFDFEKVLVTPHGDKNGTLVRWAKVEGEPYEVKEMTASNIFDFKSLLANKNWSKNTDSEKIQWTCLREVTVHAPHYDRIEYKYDFEDELKTIIVLRSGNRNKERLTREFQIEKTYHGNILISQDKYKDLINLCQSEIIPKKYHQFYKSSKFEKNSQNAPEYTYDEDN
ncbi:jg15038 [Pararge aegeria aegeria]|uniref:Jg15038 protein n=1 Tax=Pararge aegeria aegeria TaxID=348720 RepID=A0A8S4QAS4_9NEOP|nr:jg15038 [Pararge aegeria aegeria]